MSLLEISSHSGYAILSSGQGSNAHALINCGDRLKRRPSFVLATNEDSPLAEPCRELEIPFYEYIISKKGSHAEFENRLLGLCSEFTVHWLFLAGFMKILSEEFISKVDELGEGKGKILNIHPSLLPQYPGLNAYKRSFENRDKVYGHSIHIVNSVVDGGELLLQKKIEVTNFDSFESYVSIGKKAENASYSYLLEKLLTDGFEPILDFEKGQ